MAALCAGHDVLAQHPLNVRRDTVSIPMRDGVRLFAVVFRPDTEGKFPAIVYRTPYGAEKYAGYAEFPLKASKQGYVVFIVDVRGRYGSEGIFEAYRHEKPDGYDVIEWVAKRYQYSDGNVGTFGGSYLGFVQWLAMSQAPPSLKAACPDMTPIHSHQFFYVGGAFSFGWLEWFYTLMLPDLRRRAGDTTGTWDTAEAVREWESVKAHWNTLRPLASNPAIIQYVPYYNEWLAHPDRSVFWDFANIEKDFPRMSTPALIHTGWYDAVYGLLGATEGFNKLCALGSTDDARKKTRLIIGPWNHTTPGVRKTRFGAMENGIAAGLDFDRLLLDWFDAHLKNIDRQPTPPVSIFVMGENKWRYENEWPLARAQNFDFYLRQDNRLETAPPGKEPPDKYIFDPATPLYDSLYQRPVPYDQRQLESRSDVVTYTTDPLDSDVEVTGQIALELFVSSTARDTDFSFTLCDVYPDGTSLNLASLESGYLRMRYRNGNDHQELIESGRIYKIRIDNYYTSNLFQKGHRIRLSVTSSKFPHYDVNTNTGNALLYDTMTTPATQTIYHDPRHPSRLILPIIPK